MKTRSTCVLGFIIPQIWVLGSLMSAFWQEKINAWATTCRSDEAHFASPAAHKSYRPLTRWARPALTCSSCTPLITTRLYSSTCRSCDRPLASTIARRLSPSIRPRFFMLILSFSHTEPSLVLTLNRLPTSPSPSAAQWWPLKFLPHRPGPLARHCH